MQNDETTITGIIAAMLTSVAQCADDVVEEACLSLMRRHNSPFAPSAPQLYAECEKILAKRPKPAPVQAIAYQYPAEHRERMKQRFDALVAEIASGKGRDPNYGRVEKGTPPAKQIVERKVRSSFLEKWERENGRAYPHREKVLDMAYGEFKKAAE
jgi:endonuclease III